MDKHFRKAALYWAVFLLFKIIFPEPVFSKQSLPVVDWSGKENLKQMPTASANGVYDNFNLKRIDKLLFDPLEQKVEKTVSSPKNALSSQMISAHKMKHVPPSQRTQFEPGPSIPILNTVATDEEDLNYEEDDKAFSSRVYTDTVIYGNYVSKNRFLAPKDQETFYEENLRYELFTSNRMGDSFTLDFDTTWTNDRREYLEGFTLNHFAAESLTPKSRVAVGNVFPEFSQYSITNEIMGLYGEQNFESTSFKAFTGYKSIEKHDLDNPRQVTGFRLSHEKDNAVTLGVNFVMVKDSHDYPSLDYEKPTLRNTVMSGDVKIKPTDNIFLKGEYATSNTEFDRRSGSDPQDSAAYRLSAGYERENYKAEAGVETAGSTFLTAMGESPRDEKAFFGNIYYELNRYFAIKSTLKTSRDNLAGYKDYSVVREIPDLTFTLRPSDYYSDMRVDFTWQPMREYSDGIALLDRNKDMIWAEFNQKAGAMSYYAGLSGYLDRDLIDDTNDRDSNRLNLKLTWDHDNQRSLYGLFSIEQLYYKTLGGSDKTTIYGLGGKSQFHEDLTLQLDFLHEANYMKETSLDSAHDRVTMSLIKEYVGHSRFIIELQGADNRFMLSGNSYVDMSGKIRYQKSF
ncbi:MAG: hypothetical protein HQM10_09830 [Candidatus Riflebacteria bacterium]|nr:hypothetical protein [Candidatus Riflebacteria bacterium]